jgi:List-Bact-rpt repeat protein
MLLASTALFALVFLASPARAAGPYMLEIFEASDSTGFGIVGCEYKEGEELIVEEPCPEEFETKKALKMLPVPDEGYEFVIFKEGTGSAVGCSGKIKCSFTIATDSSLEVRFDEITPKLTINQTGEGEVWCETFLGLGICEHEEEYEFGTDLTLTGEPAEGWQFLGFKSGTGSASTCTGLECAIFLEEDSTISATFAPITHTLSITKAGTGQGTVTCNGTTCAASYPEGEDVTLKATPAQGSTFAGWSGEECSGTSTCVVTMLANAAVNATFEASSPTGESPTSKKGEARAGASAKVKAGKAQIKLTCSGGPCNGILKLTAKLPQGGKRKKALIGKSSFSLLDGAIHIIKVRLSAAALKELRKAHFLKAQTGGTDVLASTVKLKLPR